MSVQISDYGAVRVIHVDLPRLDSVNAPETRAQMRDAVADGPKLFLVDLSKVSFVDSSGIGALVGFVKFVGRDRRVDLCGLAPMVRKVFRLTNLLNIFNVHIDVDQALAAHGQVRNVG